MLVVVQRGFIDNERIQLTREQYIRKTPAMLLKFRHMRFIIGKDLLDALPRFVSSRLVYALHLGELDPKRYLASLVCQGYRN